MWKHYNKSIIMGISVVGIIMIQLYWLKINIFTRNEIFCNNVYRAMNITSDKINRYELNKYYKKFENIRKDLLNNINKPKVVTSKIIKDSSGYIYAYITKYIIDKDMLPVSNIYSDSISNAKIYTQEKIYKIEKDSSSNPVPILNQELDKSLEDGSFTIEKAARWDSGTTPINKRISIKMLDSIFNNSLTNIGVKNFNSRIAVLNKDKKLTEIKSPKFDEKKISFITPLFLDKNEKIQYFFAVYFTNKNISILQPMIPVIILTIIFTIIIIYVFSVSIHHIKLHKSSSEIKTDFINNMSHEFKTPIATINIATDALKNTKVYENKEKVKYYANLIKQENGRMNYHIETILKMSKLDANKYNFTFKDTNIDKVINKSIDPIKLILKQKNGSLIQEYNAKKTLVLGDNYQLENILINILDNAIKYSKENPVIKIVTYNKNNNIIIKIIDNGIGMSQNTIKKIFDKFYRLQKGNIHDVKGYGLGLSYVKKIVELHNGKVWAESKINKGSTFYIKIPLK